MISKLINPSKTDDVLFLAGAVLNIMNDPDYGGNHKAILPQLFTTMGIEGTINLIKFFGGEKVEIPSHEDMYKSFMVLVCYYKRQVEGKSWEEIKDEVGIELSPHALGKIITKIDKTFKHDAKELRDMGIEDLLKQLGKNGKQREEQPAE
jgi:hypothetical protein